jgi:hypothetical protein
MTLGQFPYTGSRCAAVTAPRPAEVLLGCRERALQEYPAQCFYAMEGV